VSRHLSLRDLYALAYLEGLQDRPDITPTDPATTIPADDTGRAALVRLRGDQPILNREQWERQRRRRVYGE
jgi:hypothetical protein